MFFNFDVATRRQDFCQPNTSDKMKTSLLLLTLAIMTAAAVAANVPSVIGDKPFPRTNEHFRLDIPPEVIITPGSTSSNNLGEFLTGANQFEDNSFRKTEGEIVVCLILIAVVVGFIFFASNSKSSGRRPTRSHLHY
ncbi:MAG: hypothetical protein V4664_02835 [Patescibacteria group bacterium]